MSGPFPIDIYDHVKFDRINLFDLRRSIPMKSREPFLDEYGGAWGFGKRKRSKAVVRVKAGRGRITVNGKPIH